MFQDPHGSFHNVYEHGFRLRLRRRPRHHRAHWVVAFTRRHGSAVATPGALPCIARRKSLTHHQVVGSRRFQGTATTVRGPGRKHGTPLSGWEQQLVSRIGVSDHTWSATRSELKDGAASAGSTWEIPKDRSAPFRTPLRAIEQSLVESLKSRWSAWRQHRGMGGGCCSPGRSQRRGTRGNCG